jgi:vanillate O-demethylase ferredoxin subunit
MKLLHVRVTAIRTEAIDIASYELVGDDGRELPPFAAGAHVDVMLPGLPARQYSLCNRPGETRRYVIAVLKEANSRGGSRHLHEKVSVGDTLLISEPKNHFGLEPTARKTLLLAGGIGVTPLFAMAQTLAEKGADFEMHYCARGRERMAFAEQLSADSYRGRVHLHLDDGADEQKLALDPLLRSRAPGDHLYVCGPTGFLDWVKASALAAGWPEDAVHTEYFAGTVEQLETDSGFEIAVEESGQVVRVAKGQTALDAMLQAGIDVPNSCTEGVCGMCMTQVRSGVPDHRDQFLTAAERARNDVFMPCCSRATTPRLTVSVDY